MIFNRYKLSNYIKRTVHACASLFVADVMSWNTSGIS
jgi:hypothetical protein